MIRLLENERVLKDNNQQLIKKIEDLEQNIHIYKTKIKNINNLSVVPDTKALVIQKTSFDIVIVEKKTNK